MTIRLARQATPLQGAVEPGRPRAERFGSPVAAVAGGTAWDVLEKLGVAEGETLLINGVGGGVGVMAAQLTRNRGAAVFGVGSETKRSMTESLGATLVPYDRGDVVEQMRQLLPGGVESGHALGKLVIDLEQTTDV